MENRYDKNEMILEVQSRSCNEGLVRIAVAAFSTQLNPTLEEVADIKTAVSEAITNCIVHAYEKETEVIRVECRNEKRQLTVVVKDKGKGIQDVKKPWSLCLPQSRSRTVPVWDLRLWKLLWTRWRWIPSRDRGPR